MATDITLDGSLQDVGAATVKRSKPRRTKSSPRAGVVRRRRVTKADAQEKALRTSEILRNLLAQNPDKSFTVEKIVGALGTSSFGTSLMAFSIPEVLPIPIPGISAMVALPTGIISAQMMGGKKKITLPKWLLKRSVPRKALAAAIHSILPVLERVERGVRPRWPWATSPVAKRFLGFFILVLAGLIALPVPGTNMPAAIAIFVIALGLVEKDGMLISLGILIGLASVALVGGVTLGIFSLFRRLLP